MNAQADAAPAVFTKGSTLRHVLVMTGAGSIGLMAVFFVDLLSLLYISRLGDPDLTAAIGYASQIIFFSISINIGLIIAVGALVSRALGAGDRERARRLSASYLTHVVIASAVFTIAVLPERHAALELFGARGRALEIGATYLAFTLPATVLLGLGMALSAVLRATGDARRAMYVTLAGGIVTAILDPIFIFGFGLGIYGAATVTLISRAVFVIVGLHGAVLKHDLVGRPQWPAIWQDLPAMLTIAIPAILTNLATPVANAYTTRIFSQFGTQTVAAFAIIDRVTPVAFGVLFALSSSVGPIMGQNLGAGLFSRVQRTLTDCLTVAASYTIIVGLLLWQATPLVVWVFNAAPETTRVVAFFCAVGGALWLFLGGIFVANAAFNNLGFPVLSTVFNWGRATLGTIPFVTYGAARGGAEGGILGMTAGAALFGVAAIVTAYWVTRRLANRATTA